MFATLMRVLIALIDRLLNVYFLKKEKQSEVLMVYNM